MELLKLIFLRQEVGRILGDFFSELLSNVCLWIAVLSWAIAQLIKVLMDLYKTKKFNLSLFISSGSMPSSHSSFVTALTTAVGIREGFGSTLFAVSAVLSMIVMYDAAGVRRAAGKQAEVINLLVQSVENTGIILDKKLKELLGHSPIEVAAGAVLGIAIGIIFA